MAAILDMQISRVCSENHIDTFSVGREMASLVGAMLSKDDAMSSKYTVFSFLKISKTQPTAITPNALID